jgi:ABC-type multidrug transport system ATPase subunit
VTAAAQLERITKASGAVKAVDDVSLTIERGSLTC